MDDKELNKLLSQTTLLVRTIAATVSLLVTFVILLASGVIDDLFVNGQEPPISEVVDGIHVETGLIDAPGLQLVIQNCTNCHSSKLISQNRMNMAGWSSTIKWMQETQNLWDLGDSEAAILKYLAANYAPKKKGRRANLENIEWYELE